MTDRWGDVPPGPDRRWARPAPPQQPPWSRQPAPLHPGRLGAGAALAWAVVGLVLTAVADVVVFSGTGLVLLDLLWNGFVHAASAGEEGTTRTAATLVRSGNLFVVAPLVLVAAVCTVVALVRGRGTERGRRVTVWATVLTAATAFLVLATAAVTA